MTAVNRDFGKIELPCRMALIGPTKCGKSHFMSQCVQFRDQLFDGSKYEAHFSSYIISSLFFPEFERIIYCAPLDDTEKGKTYIASMERHFENLEVLTDGLPNIQRFKNNEEAILLILDDYYQLITESYMYNELFVRYSHHFNISVIWSLQNAFPRGKYALPIMRNQSNYLIFFNPGNQHSIDNLSRTIFGKCKMNVVPYCFEWLQKHRPHLTYILVKADARDIDYKYRIVTNLFPEIDGKFRWIFLHPTRK